MLETQTPDDAGYELRIVLRNSSGGELDARPVKNDADLRPQLIGLILDSEFIAGDTIHIEGSE
jgi:hypothetical protein